MKKRKVTPLRTAAFSLALGSIGCELKEDRQQPAVVEIVSNSEPAPLREPKSVLHQLTSTSRSVPSRTITKRKGFPTVSGSESNEIDSLKGELSISFTPRDYTLYGNDLLDLNRFIKENKGEQNFVVEGHADYKGRDIGNENFARMRAKNVADQLKKKVKDAKIIIAECGAETKPKSNTPLVNYDRSAVIHSAGVLDHLLSKVGGDHVLINSTTSMNALFGRDSKWSQIANHSFPQSTNVYTYTRKGVSSSELSSHNPSGTSAPLFTALHEVIKQAKRNQSITLVTDSNDYDSDSKHNFATVITAANARGVNIHVIGIGDNVNLTGLKVLAKETQGTWCHAREYNRK